MADGRPDFANDGAQHFIGVVDSLVAEALGSELDIELGSRPGKRLPNAFRQDLLGSKGPVGRIAAHLIGDAARPVRVVLFDKTEDRNWIVAWHQDRTIVVRERQNVHGFGPWSTKDGALHVAPPIEVLQGMTTLRLHLDPCDDDNAPLRVALGSHRLGRVPSERAAEIATASRQHVCHADVGDVWAYVTPILHASDPSRSRRRRRVLQIDYAAVDLPSGLEWASA